MPSTSHLFGNPFPEVRRALHFLSINIRFLVFLTFAEHRVSFALYLLAFPSNEGYLWQYPPRPIVSFFSTAKRVSGVVSMPLSSEYDLFSGLHHLVTGVTYIHLHLYDELYITMLKFAFVFVSVLRK